MADQPTSEMPATFRAALDAALARPVMLHHAALESVRVAAGFKPRADANPAGASAETALPFTRDGNVAVVCIDGPLAQKAWSCWMFSGDGYDAIEMRVRAALDDAQTGAVLLRLDSPGGEVAGCFEAMRSLRAYAAERGKPIVAYASEFACSAAYAMACIGGSIVVPDTGIVGSVGVITVVGDRVGANEADGINKRVVRSGALKAVPHPDEPLTDAGVEHVQEQVDALAQIFAKEVATARGMTVDAVLALEAATFLGADAVTHKLADKVGNYRDAVALASELAAGGPPAKKMSARANTGAPVSKISTSGAKKMNTVTQALGLEAGASEAEIFSAVTTLKQERAELIRATGGANHTAALGAIEGMKASTERLKAVEANNAQLLEQLEGKERDALLAEGRKAGKITPALATLYAKESPEKLRAFLAVAPVIPALAESERRTESGPRSSAKSGARMVDPSGRKFEDLSPGEQKRLKAADPDLYNAMREDWHATDPRNGR